jgi:hypothetical protein
MIWDRRNIRVAPPEGNRAGAGVDRGEEQLRSGLFSEVHATSKVESD